MTLRAISRRLAAIEVKLASSPRPKPDAVPYAELTDEQLVAMILDNETKLAKLQALAPAERERWERELDRAADLPNDGTRDYIRRMSDEQLTAAIIRAEQRWRELEQERGGA